MGVTKGSVAELQEFFDTTTIKQNHIKLSNFETITDINKFLSSHLSLIKKNIGKYYAIPYQDRLYKFKDIIENEKTKD